MCVCVGGDDSGGDGGGVDLPATPQHTDFIPQGLILHSTCCRRACGNTTDSPTSVSLFCSS